MEQNNINNTKTGGNKSKLWGLIPLAIIIFGGVWLWWSQADTANTNSDKSQAELLASMTDFKVVREDISDEKIDQYFLTFDKAKDIFLADPSAKTNFTILMTMANIKNALGDYEGTLEILLYNYNNFEKNSYVLNGNIAHIYNYFLPDYEQAEFFYNEALKSESIASANEYTYYAELYDLYYYNLEDKEKSEEVIDRAIEAMPEEVSVYFLAGDHYKREGDKAKARQYFNKILELDPSNEGAKQILNNL